MLRGVGRLRSGGSIPALGLDFVSSEAIDSRLTTSGGANGTRVNSAGVIVAATCPRFDYDPVTLAARGLLVEEARTNLLVRSAEFDNASWTKTVTVAADQTTGPDGTTSADKLTATGADQLAEQTAAATAGSAYTFSVYIKSVSAATTLDIKLASDSTGAAFASQSVTTTDAWQRVTLTGTVPVGQTAIRARIGGGSTFSTGETIYIWGAQLEAGSFATSYIPTAGATVTRTADSVMMTGANFSSWYNASQGTLVVEASTSSTQATNRFIYEVSDGTTNNTIINYANSGNAAAFQTIVGGVTGVDLTAGSAVVAGTVFKGAMAVSANNSIAAKDGTLSSANTTSTPPSTVNQLRLGARVNGNASLNGHIRTLRYYPSRLPNAQLQALTA